jgi:hypothetical protein
VKPACQIIPSDALPPPPPHLSIYQQKGRKEKLFFYKIIVNEMDVYGCMFSE